MRFLFVGLLLFLLLIYSCSPKKDSEIFIFNNLTFKTLNKERIIPIIPATEKHYRSVFNNQPKIQIPLLKYFEHPSYNLFLGIPFNTSLKKYKQSFIQSRPNDTLICKDNFCLIKYQREKKYFGEYIHQTAKGTLVYLALECESKNIVDSLFTEKALATRLFEH